MLLHAKAASTTWLCMEFVMGDGYFTVIHYFAPFSITQRFWSQYFHRKHCRAPRTEWSACIRAAGFLSACGKGRQCSWAVHPRYTGAPAHTGFWRAGLSFSAPRWIRPTAFQTAPEENQISAGWLWKDFQVDDPPKIAGRYTKSSQSTICIIVHYEICNKLYF